MTLAGLPLEPAFGTGPLRAPRTRTGRAHASRASRPASRSLGPSGLQATPTELSQVRGRPRLADGASRAWAPKSARSRSFAPTRSTRAPPVVGPWLHRLESPAQPKRIQHVRHAGRTPRRSHLAGPACAEPAGPPAPRSPSPAPACAFAWPWHARRCSTGWSRSPFRDETKSPGPPHPCLREEAAGSAAPEVPSIDELPTCP